LEIKPINVRFLRMKKIEGKVFRRLNIFLSMKGRYLFGMMKVQEKCG
jgi:hypothetical protein